MGNCEEQLAADADDCGCGFAPGSTCDQLSVSWYGFARAQLDASDRAWMAGLPRRIDLQIGNKRFAVVHGSVNEINRFVFLSTPKRVKATDLTVAHVDGIIAGHSGLPFSQSIGSGLWHNPGVVGMPANDGTPRTWFSVLTASESGSIAIEHATLRYDCGSAAAAIRRSGLPTVYADALESGNWPNCEILPPHEASMQGTPIREAALEWNADGASSLSWPHSVESKPIDPNKFRHPDRTANGSPRARVELVGLKTLWINTGTVCNLQCANCYIESTPRNDRLAFISVSEVEEYLAEIERDNLPTEQIGFTGGEPFMNPEFLTIFESTLQRKQRVLILTNAMKPMQRVRDRLHAINTAYGESLSIRVSVDHYTRELHELERGPRSWKPTIDGLVWLARSGFDISVAGRLYSGEVETIVRSGYARSVQGSSSRDRRLRSDAAHFVSGNGRASRCAGDFGYMLERAERQSGGHDVRDITNGCEAARNGQTDSRRLHTDTIRPRLRTGFEPSEGEQARFPQPSALRKLLRAGRKLVRPRLTRPAYVTSKHQRTGAK